MADAQLSVKENGGSRLESLRRAIAAPFAGWMGGVLARSGIHPNLISTIGLLVGMAAAAVAGWGYLFWAGVLVLVSGIFDLLDGAVARAGKKITKFGGVLDSTLDRVGEAALLLGLLVFFVREPSTWGVLLAFITLMTSGLVSYIKARAEAAGVACPVGMFTRAERVILLALGLMIGQIVIVLAIIAALSFATAMQRLLYVWQQMKEKE